MANNNKIYRSKKDYFIAGVCGGIAKHFGIDSTLVRLIFVLLTIGGGSGVLIYLVLWLIIPTDPSEKLLDKHEGNDLGSHIRETVNEARVENDRVSFLGLILIIIGILALGNQIIPALFRWDFLWPVVLIIAGLYFILKR